MNTILICIIRKQDEKKIPFKLFFKTASFHQRYIHINFYTKWLAFFTSLTSHESKSSLESAVHESNSSPKSLFMWLKCDSSPSRRLEFPSLAITFPSNGARAFNRATIKSLKKKKYTERQTQAISWDNNITETWSGLFWPVEQVPSSNHMATRVGRYGQNYYYNIFPMSYDID